MKTYTLRVAAKDREIFNAVKNGRKKVETRAASPRFKKLEQGDSLLFVCGSKKLRKTAGQVRKVRSVEALLKIYKPRDINPAAKTAIDLHRMYASFAGYTEKIKKEGLLVIELQ